jgi:hypothetical protein
MSPGDPSIAIAVLAVIATTVSLSARPGADAFFLPYWARYNYTGYESGQHDDFTAKSWPEYRAFSTPRTRCPGTDGLGG